jgi:hypothetical protein
MTRVDWENAFAIDRWFHGLPLTVALLDDRKTEISFLSDLLVTSSLQRSPRKVVILGLRRDFSAFRDVMERLVRANGCCCKILTGGYDITYSFVYLYIYIPMIL